MCSRNVIYVYNYIKVACDRCFGCIHSMNIAKPREVLRQMGPTVMITSICGKNPARKICRANAYLHSLNIWLVQMVTLPGAGDTYCIKLKRYISSGNEITLNKREIVNRAAKYSTNVSRLYNEFYVTNCDEL